MEVEDSNSILAPADGTLVSKDGPKMSHPDLLADGFAQIGFDHLLARLFAKGRILRRLHEVLFFLKGLRDVQQVLDGKVVRTTMLPEAFGIESSVADEGLSLEDLTFEKASFDICEKLNALKACECALSKPTLCVLRTTKMACFCIGSFQRPLEMFSKNFGKCPFTLETLDRASQFSACELGIKTGLALSDEMCAQLKNPDTVFAIENFK